jgi:tRNA (cytidine/uridine-2'-O-)-methyltransferase
MRIVLVEPEIPQNTGSVARLAAATRTPLDLVRPLGFSLEDRYLKRAGLDYWPLVDVTVHENWNGYLAVAREGRLLAFSAKRGRPYTECCFRADDNLCFGRETTGLGTARLASFGELVYTIPIDEAGVRSLNLAQAVAIVVYEARRQLRLDRTMNPE